MNGLRKERPISDNCVIFAGLAARVNAHAFKLADQFDIQCFAQVRLAR